MKKIFLFIFLTLFISAISQEPTPQRILNKNHPLVRGMVACWPLTEGGGKLAFDYSGYQPTPGGLNLDAVFSKSYMGNCASFDGTGDYILCKSAPILGGLTNWSVVAWHKSGLANISGGRPLYCERASTGNDILKLETQILGAANNVAAITYRNDGGTLIQLAGTRQINFGAWHQIVATKEGTAIKLYVDGKLDNSGTYGSASDAFTNSGIESRIGGDKASSTNSQLGFIGCVQLYNRTLRPDEIAQMYSSFYTMFIKPPRSHL